ncbi:SulP family inorganic anion transporter [Parvularcula sp. ZS-1/3]|uniref:SulP family inorganic anion transporter n=1 Tax=Parvularcula mediterranea TaxID=2732508 RepID=A0A7Y3W6P8_9PROT|nr:SulP family inorganic anion transporter [Parvularcula mediterranea]NNU17587.1 SulP family inorganic anion transporter [Parvularcula mediterranea]
MFDFKHIKGDIYGGVTAGIVALPLALAFGEASGAGPIAGLWGAIITGFFAAAFGGTNTQITGPTGPMVVVFAGLVAEITAERNADFAEVSGIIFAAVILAGILQILFGIFKVGQYIRLVPYPVISGFMSGIGVIIILLQASRLFGGAPERGGTLGGIEAIPGAIMNLNPIATVIGFVSLGIVFFWPKSIGKFVPGALAALIIGTLLALPFGADQVPKLVSDIPVFETFGDRFPAFVIPNLDPKLGFLILESAIILALLGAIDSLLTSLVADNATRTRHDSNKELIGQGIGNSIAGFFGAIPGAGATMRTMVNIKTGGMTKLSGMIAGSLLFLIVVALTPLAAEIPHAVLAGILVKVGWDIIDFAYITRSHKGPRWDLILMALVLLVTVFFDLIAAVGLGVFLAALGFAQSVAKEQLEAIGEERFVSFTDEEKAIYDKADGRIRMFEFTGPLSFGAAADIAHRVRQNVKGREVLILDFTQMPTIDVSAVYALQSIIEDAKRENRHVILCNVNAEVRKMLDGLAILSLAGQTDVDITRLQALQRAETYLAGASSGTAEGTVPEGAPA